MLSEPSDSSFVLRGTKLSRQSIGAQDAAPLPRDLCQLTSHARAIKLEGAGHWVAKEQTGRSNRGPYSRSCRLPLTKRKAADFARAPMTANGMDRLLPQRDSLGRLITHQAEEEQP